MGLKFIESKNLDLEIKRDNLYFEERLDTSSEWIEKRTGIKTRFFTELNTEEMTKKLVKNFKSDIENLDLIICASFSTKRRMPSLSSIARETIGANENVLCLDINLACAGFSAALILAEKYLEKGRKALIFACEKISDYMDFSDRSTAILFGDGAAGVIVEKNEKLFISDTKSLNHENTLNLYEGETITMEGKKVYRFAVEEVPKSLKKLMCESDLKPDEIDKIILHQANYRIINSVLKNLEIDEDKSLSNLDVYGNTSAATIPIVIAENFKKIKDGEILLISGFGAGLSVVSILMECWDEFRKNIRNKISHNSGRNGSYCNKWTCSCCKWSWRSWSNWLRRHECRSS